MTTFLLIVASGLVTGTWLLARVRTLHPPTIGGTGPTTVSIIIPARDEASTLPTLLGSIGRLDHPPGEILVVDDDSDDDTAALARQLGATVVSAGPVPAGWFGKPWACHVGAAAATGSVLVFLDTDTELAGDALGAPPRDPRDPPRRAAVGAAVPPDRARLRAAVRLLQRRVDARLGGLHPEGRRRKPRRVSARRLVTSADAYRAVGGHELVRHEVLEDVALARRYRSCGRPVRCLAGADTVRFRMYPDGLTQLVEGWTKNLAGGPAVAPLWATVGATLWVCAGAAVAARALGLIVSGTSPADAGVTGLSWAAVAVQLRWMLRRVGAFRWWTAIAFPLPLLAFMAWFVRSAVHRRLHGSVRWRGRELSIRTAR